MDPNFSALEKSSEPPYIHDIYSMVQIHGRRTTYTNNKRSVIVMARRCAKVLANGKRCKAHALKGQKYCLFHSTKNQGLKAAQRGGGKPFRNYRNNGSAISDSNSSGHGQILI